MLLHHLSPIIGCNRLYRVISLPRCHHNYNQRAYQCDAESLIMPLENTFFLNLQYVRSFCRVSHIFQFFAHITETMNHRYPKRTYLMDGLETIKGIYKTK